MAQYLTLSRAARLAGIKRGALQKKISAGELPTFEGMIELSDLMAAYPEADVEDTAMLERVDQIKAKAVPRSLREPNDLPDLETVSARVMKLTEELARTRGMLQSYTELLERAHAKLQALEAEHPSEALHQVRTWLEQSLKTRAEAPLPPEQILLKDTLLRIMAAHVQIFPSGHEFFVEGNESILDAGLRAGYALSYGCRDGSCGECKGRLLAGKVKKTLDHPYRLTEQERKLGYILTCSHTAITDTELQLEEAQHPADIHPRVVSGRVKRIDRPSDDVVVLHLRTPPSQRLRFLAGQHVVLRAADVPAATYSVASCPCEESYLQFHIQRNNEEPFSRYAFERMQTDDAIELEGPAGELVLDNDSPRSLVLIAWGTGFAPIKSLTENAVALDVAESIHLYWVDKPGGHYLKNVCRAWHDALDNFRYTPVTIEDNGDAVRQHAERVLEQVLGDHRDVSSFDFYIAAPADVLGAALPYLRTRGVPTAQIASEPLCQGPEPGFR